MKILHIIPSYKPAYVYGGPIYSVSSLCENQAKAGHNVTVYTTTANGKRELIVRSGEVYEIEGVTVRYFKRLTKDHSHFSPKLLAQLHRTIANYEVIHIHSWWNLVAIGAAVVAAINRTTVVISPRGGISTFGISKRNSLVKSLFSRMIGKSLLKRAVIHATSEVEWGNCQSFIGGIRGFIAPNILSLPINHAGLEMKATGVFKVGFLGRLHPIKGIETLMEAISKLEMPVEVVIAGDGDEAYKTSLLRLTKELGVSNCVKWLGEITEKYRYLRSCDVVVVPSVEENFSNVVIEALSVGTAVIITEKVGVRSFVEEHNLGWVILNESGELANALDSARTDELKRNQIRSKAPDLVAKHFNSYYLTEQYLTAYSKFIHGVGISNYTHL